MSNKIFVSPELEAQLNKLIGPENDQWAKDDEGNLQMMVSIGGYIFFENECYTEYYGDNGDGTYGRITPLSIEEAEKRIFGELRFTKEAIRRDKIREVI